MPAVPISRAQSMRGSIAALLALLVLCGSPVDAIDGCPYLASVPFRPRAVRQAEHIWTGDLFLTSWQPGLMISLSWHQSAQVLQVNHADITEMRAHGVTIRLQASGPDDEARVMLHLAGESPTIPSHVTCHLSTTAAIQAPTALAMPSATPPTTPTATRPLPVPARPVPAALSGVHAHTDTSTTPSASSSSTLFESTVLSADGGMSGDAPCASAFSDLRLEQLSSGAAVDVGTTISLGCDEIALRLPRLRLCQPTDHLSLLWIPPASSLWAPLHETLPSGQSLVMLDNLSPNGAYLFRLRLTRASTDPTDASDAITLGPEVGPILVDGAPLTTLMAAASPTATSGASPLVPRASSSSSIRMPWPMQSPCRPHLRYSVTARPAHSVTSAGSVAWQLKVPAADVSVDRGELVVERLRCPTGCRLAIAPLGVTGFSPLARLTSSVTTAPLTPIPPNGCRLEIRLAPLGTSTASAAFAAASSAPMANRPTHVEIQAALAHDLCPAIGGCEPDQVRTTHPVPCTRHPVPGTLHPAPT